MTSQGHPARAPAVFGAESLATAALTNLWKHLDRMLPLWFALAVFHALTHVALRGESPDLWPLQAILNREASALMTLGVSALASAIALRVLFGRSREAVQPDGALGAYVGTVLLLAVAPTIILMGWHAPGPGTLKAELSDDLARVMLGLSAAAAVFWVALRLTLWPIARLLGDTRVTAEQSWQLMRGAVARYAGAMVLLLAPLVTIAYILSLFRGHAPPMLVDAALAPVQAAITLAATAVAAEIYRMRMGLS
jgi:hypothetical protein